MLRKPFHKQEIQKLSAIRTPSPDLNSFRGSPGLASRPTPLTSLSPSPLPPLFFFCQNFPPTSPSGFTHHQSLSTSSLATGTYYSREDPNLNVESLRESSDHRGENGRDGEGFGSRTTLSEERVLLFTCVPEDGNCLVYCFWTKHNSLELSRKQCMLITYGRGNVPALYECRCDHLGTFLQKHKVVNKIEVYPGDIHRVAMEELMKHGVPVIPLKKQVANKLEVYLGHRFRVAYEEAINYGIVFMMKHHFPVQVALCDRRPLRRKIAFIRSSLAFEKCNHIVGPWKRRDDPARFSRLWRICVLLLLEWIQSSTYLGRKDGHGRHNDDRSQWDGWSL